MGGTRNYFYRGGPVWQTTPIGYFGILRTRDHVWYVPIPLGDITGDGFADFGVANGGYDPHIWRNWVPVWIYRGGKKYGPVGVESSRPVPNNVSIDVFPNPVAFPRSEPATIRLSLPGTTSGELVIYDRLGRKVRTVYAGRYEGKRFEKKVDVSDLPPGYYFFLLRTGKISLVKSLVVI